METALPGEVRIILSLTFYFLQNCYHQSTLTQAIPSLAELGLFVVKCLHASCANGMLDYVMTQPNVVRAPE